MLQVEAAEENAAEARWEAEARVGGGEEGVMVAVRAVGVEEGALLDQGAGVVVQEVEVGVVGGGVLRLDPWVGEEVGREGRGGSGEGGCGGEVPAANTAAAVGVSDVGMHAVWLHRLGHGCKEASQLMQSVAFDRWVRSYEWRCVSAVP